MVKVTVKPIVCLLTKEDKRNIDICIEARSASLFRDFVYSFLGRDGSCHEIHNYLLEHEKDTLPSRYCKAKHIERFFHSLNLIWKEVGNEKRASISGQYI